MIKKEIKILRKFANSINLESLYRFLVYNFFICYTMMMDMSVPLTDYLFNYFVYAVFSVLVFQVAIKFNSKLIGLLGLLMLFSGIIDQHMHYYLNNQFFVTISIIVTIIAFNLNKKTSKKL